MWQEIINWWKNLWTEQKVVAGALSGFIAAFLMFIIKDALWQSRVARIQRKTDFWQKQYDYFYSPLYLFYRQAFIRFDNWKRENPDSQLQRQPFFEPSDDTKVEEKIFDEHPGYASHSALQLWTNFKSLNDKIERNNQRNKMVVTLVKEYQDLRRKLGLDYDKEELKTGEFKKQV